MRAPNSALAALMLASLTGGFTERVGTFVLEGRIAPELALTGSALMEASRDSIFCKDYLLPRPAAKGHTVGSVFRRLDGDRYSLSYDFREVPQGEFCRYTLRVVQVEAYLRKEKSFTISAASFVPEYCSAPGGGEPSNRRRPR